MIDKIKIKLNDTVYYTTSYSGAISVIVLKVFDNDTALVRTPSKKKELSPFVRPLAFLFCDAESAKRNGRDWENFEKKRKKELKQQKKQKNEKNGGDN